MGHIKFESNLFLGTNEYDRLFRFLADDGYKAVFGKMLSSPGFLRRRGENFDDLKVIAGVGSGALTLKAGTLLDNNIDLITINEDLVDALTVPSDSNTYFVVASYNTTSEEVGEVNVDAAGNLSGTGTKFTEVLRGLPYHATKIKFPTSALNTGEYDVLEVLSDTSAILNIAGALQAENKIKYSVVGTFSPGSAPTISQKFPFQYSSITLELVNALPGASELGLTKFALANVSFDGSTLTINDTRDDYVEFSGADKIVDLEENPILAIERAMWTGDFSDKGSSLVDVAWGWLSGSADYTVNNQDNIITILDGSGGAYSGTQEVQTGDFDGWRVYFDSGDYTRVISTSLSGGNVVLQVENASLVPANSQVIIVPDTDFVTIFVTPSSQSQYQSLENQYIFPSFNRLGRVPTLFIPDTAFDETQSILVKYQACFHNGTGFGSEKIDLNSNVYEDERSFDNDGQSASQTFLSNYGTSSAIRLRRNPQAHEISKASLIEANTFNAIQRYTFGVDVNNDGGLVDVGTDGNTFELDVTSGGIRGVLGTGVGTIVSFIPNSTVDLDPSGLNQQELSSGYKPIETPNATSVQIVNGDFFTLIETASTWKLIVIPARQQLPSSVPPVGTIVMWEGNVSNNFDSSGLGNSSILSGWAVCNGNNGTPDLRGRFIVGAIDSVPDVGAPSLSSEVDPNIAGNENYAAGDIGGEQRHTLTIAEMPQHSHIVQDPGHTHTGTYDQALTVDGTNTVGQIDNQAGEPNLTESGQISTANTGITLSNTGQSGAHENRPPFYAVIYIKRIQ